ncbi:MAG: hypothetical protein JW969_16910 [Spirochaetales bacterium]|nr:hypothetical protein [Spirochaetales bacterium]
MASEKELARVIRSFSQCMLAKKGSEEEKNLAYKFNRLFDRYLKNHREASQSTIANYLSKLGVPYQDAMNDLIYVQRFGYGKI